MQYWLMKSEPECYSIADLRRERTAMWDGVRNYQVRNMFRDDFKKGDKALFYHSNAGDETGVVGEMTVAKEAYPDPTQFDPKSDHPDLKSDPKDPRWLAVDVRYQNTFKRPVTLRELKNDPRFKGLPVVEKGNRLSVMPVRKDHYEAIVKLGSQ